MITDIIDLFVDVSNTFGSFISFLRAKFKNYDVIGLRNCIDLALDLWFNHKKIWKKLQMNATAMEYGWDSSAEEYRKLYKGLL